ncbi:MAG: tRNA lysidine(34) synthetase TilS [Idiomarina sp.]|nr:tRNA lysidine(34) synthetase TilS [Idiomarina sp.]
MANVDLFPVYVQQMAALQLQPGQQIVVALGGGADSQTVLDLTLRYREQHPQYRYLAIHLDHYFHPDSPQWAEFLKGYCARANIDAIVEPLAVPQGPRMSKEEQGREARYQRMAELISDDAVLLLGQHQNDQVETLLLQLKRGAGPKGLAAMAAVADFQQAQRICRPLLTVSKAQIYAYAQQFGVEWIEDTTNADTRIERNFMRHEVVPVLCERWPQFLTTASRSAALCAEQSTLLDELLAERLAERIEGDGRLRLTDWWQLSAQLQRGLLRAWLQHRQVKAPSFALLNELQTQIQRSQGGKQVRVSWGSVTVQRKQKWLELVIISAPESGAGPSAKNAE